MRRLLAVVALCAGGLMLGGCAGWQPGVQDDAYGTFRVPSAEDCQYRRFEGSGGGGFGASVSGSLKTLTITGPAGCRTKETIDAVKDVL